MPGGLEVERKWLISALPEAELARASSSEEIDQGYLTIGQQGGETRVRSRAGQFVLTVKSGTGMVRSETSVEISREQFDALWPATEGQRVEKVRHLIALPERPELLIELDVYTGSLAGLIVAEVEFENEAEATGFQAPSWFGAEVTHDARYKNHSLALQGRL